MVPVGHNPSMANLDLSRAKVLTFDCYGTLVDWEAGILGALHRYLPRGVASDDALLEEYAALEAAAEAGPYKRYREVLGESLAAVIRHHGVSIGGGEVAELGGSVVDWPAFPDSAGALKSLTSRFDLGVITNCDDDLFGASNSRLGEPFRWVITAQQAGSYKPSLNNFHLAFERIGVARDEIIHVAQSLFHDHVPAKHLGVQSVWINRRADQPGAGATPPAEATPDATFTDMASFASYAAAK
jgi:2-haloacid dehalogenase